MPGILHSLERGGHLVAARLAGRYSNVDLTAAEADFLFHAIHDGGRRTPLGKLRKAAGRTPSTTTAVIDRLERAALVERAPNPEDRRSFLVVLTPRGRQVAKAVADRVASIEAALRRRLRDDQIAALHALVDALEALDP
jgi:DNA-binding MarR family transcriptional regulator